MTALVIIGVLSLGLGGCVARLLMSRIELRLSRGAESPKRIVVSTRVCAALAVIPSLYISFVVNNHFGMWGLYVGEHFGLGHLGSVLGLVAALVAGIAGVFAIGVLAGALLGAFIGKGLTSSAP